MSRRRTVVLPPLTAQAGVRLSQEEYDLLYNFIKERGLSSMSEAFRILIHEAEIKERLRDLLRIAGQEAKERDRLIEQLRGDLSKERADSISMANELHNLQERMRMVEGKLGIEKGPGIN